jgi:DNA polymerase III subunit epsilon
MEWTDVTDLDRRDLEEAIEKIAGHPDVRVLRRLHLRESYGSSDGRERIGVILDTETTGLDVHECGVLELALLKFGYTAAGVVTRIIDRYCEYNDPGVEIDEVVQRLTGITPEIVAGCAIDWREVDAFCADADLVIAHNAAFDRRVVERFSTAFMLKPWACSREQVPWGGRGASTQLGYLAMDRGLFFDGHNAMSDCEAALHLLAEPLLPGAPPALYSLLMDVATPMVRLYAVGAPFETKDALKRRGYRFNPAGAPPHEKTWFATLTRGAVDAEVRWLCANVVRRPATFPTYQIRPEDRFSVRA